MDRNPRRLIFNAFSSREALYTSLENAMLRERSDVGQQDVYRRLPLRLGALRMHHRSGDGDRVQLLDLHQEGTALHLSSAEELSATRRRRQSARISLQQAC